MNWINELPLSWAAITSSLCQAWFLWKLRYHKLFVSPMLKISFNRELAGGDAEEIESMAAKAETFEVSWALIHCS